MDQYRRALQHDVRIISRNQRHHQISQRQIDVHRNALPDVSEQARWLDQDGSLCGEERSRELMQLHREGYDFLLSEVLGTQKEQVALPATPGEVEEQES